MLKVLIGPAVAAVCAMPSPAFAAPVSITGPWWAQHAVDEMQTPVPDGQVLILAACPGWPQLAACNFPTPDSAIYIPRQFYSRTTLYRELGGRFDTLAMTPGARLRFATLIHRPRSRWAMAAAGDDIWGLVDVFEDAYADCALGLSPHRITLQRPENARWVDDNDAYHPSRKVHLRVCTLIRRVGIRASLAAPTSRTSRR
jgi:hypothetical protein